MSFVSGFSVLELQVHCMALKFSMISGALPSSAQGWATSHALFLKDTKASSFFDPKILLFGVPHCLLDCFLDHTLKFCPLKASVMYGNLYTSNHAPSDIVSTLYAWKLPFLGLPSF